MKQRKQAAAFGGDFVPVLTVRRNLAHFARDSGIALEYDADEFDKYAIAYLETDSGCRFLLLHYAGADENTFDVWLPTEVADYRSCMRDIVDELEVPPKDIIERELSENAFQRRVAM
jgi:hypothetical protein